MYIFHLMRKSLSKFNSKLVECMHPVTNGHGPLLGKRVHGQRDDLGDGHLEGKNAVMGSHFAWRHVTDSITLVGEIKDAQCPRERQPTGSCDSHESILHPLNRNRVSPPKSVSEKAREAIPWCSVFIGFWSHLFCESVVRSDEQPWCSGVKRLDRPKQPTYSNQPLEASRTRSNTDPRTEI